MVENLENSGEELVSLCEPRMRACKFKQADFDAVTRASNPKPVYAGIFPHGELPIKGTYFPARELPYTK